MAERAGAEREGVVRYRAEHAAAVLPAAWGALAAELAAWRRTLAALGWFGRDPKRYDGYGFGNLSARLPDGAGFLVTGTQTGGEAHLPLAGFACVERWSIAGNAVWSRGGAAASSESMTHAALYEAAPEVGAVFHVHAREPWRRRRELGLAETAAGVPYGTPEMAAAVAAAWRAGAAGVLAMAGHEDGLLAWGADPEQAGRRLIALA